MLETAVMVAAAATSTVSRAPLSPVPLNDAFVRPAPPAELTPCLNAQPNNGVEAVAMLPLMSRSILTVLAPAGVILELGKKN